MEPITPDQQTEQAWTKRRILGGVLIGGSSTRMGRTKSLLRYQEKTFVELVIAVLRQRVERVVLLGEGQTPEVPPEIARLPDAPGLAGPLAGILAALRWQPQACWIVVACDLPLLRVAALDWLLAQRRPQRWAVLPRVGPERVEPLLAIYEPESLTLLEDIVTSGHRSPRHLEGHAAVHSPTPPVDLHDCWTNVNTPEEYRRLIS
jgi:molybdopterin-guanine dinucleotide biosynthesis protein A